MFRKSIGAIALAMFVLAFVVVVTGCGGKEEPPPQKTVTKEVDPPGVTTIHEEEKAPETVAEEPEAEKKKSTSHIAKPKRAGEQDLQSMKNLDKKTEEVKTKAEEESKKGKMKFKDH